MSGTQGDLSDKARVQELERRLGLVEDLLYEMIQLLPREAVHSHWGILYPILCELDGVSPIEDPVGCECGLEEPHEPPLRLIKGAP